MQKLLALPTAVKQYLMITLNYWCFTLTDGALRMLVVLYFYQLGYQPIAIAMLFLFYEVFGVVTNFVGGWLGARFGLNKIMNIGLFLQVFALLMLAVPEQYLTVIWVMFAQAMSGIAKDLNKMSAKSSIKVLLPNKDGVADSRLFKWVALLTGSKNALKGAGFFLGAALLSWLGFKAAVISMAAVLLVIAITSILYLKTDLGKTKSKVKFSQMFSTYPALNYLSAARLFLFASRDVWFVVALPVYFAATLGWQHDMIGGFMAIWVICYGIVQANVPKLLAKFSRKNEQSANVSGGLLSFWAAALAVISLSIPVALTTDLSAEVIVVTALMLFGVVFAINSSLHSYAIVAIAKEDGVSMDVGFYYTANAMGRLVGTVLSGGIYQYYGLEACLMSAGSMALLSAVFIRKIAK